ncbi:MAG: molecular chaperone HtpG [Betaproteobacteria bacterium]|nr:MAG: molecular chaperone HtpG [Betaproteobacteria bacterium]
MAQAAAKQTLGFQAEVKQLLSLMIHSLYSNKEIFLRELISNGSDAADKLRFEALAQPALYEDAAELRVTLRIDKAARTLTVADNGIGMSRDEVIANIGTIAKSGTREFLATLSGDQQKDARLIGQFGVGFYASFIVADRVTLVTRRAGLPAEEGVRWESDGSGEYTLEPAPRRNRGTEVTLHLREGEDELLEPWSVKGIVRKYSDHIGLPIVLVGESQVDPVSREFMPGKEETLNQASALWARPKSEISDAQYREFYKHVAHDFEDPLAWAHARVEGRQEYTQLLYLPARAPVDLWERHARHGVKLYVQRVFIMEDAEHLMPAYLRFVRGVIDADSLPLNVSREILQQSRDLEAIRGGCSKRILGLLEDLAANQPEKYATFWSEFGRVFKEGAAEDAANRERIAKLLRFASTHAEGEAQSVSLADYVARMKPGQDRIWYVTAESFGAARSSPHLEVFRRKGVEVLLLGERVDEWLVSSLTEFEGKPLASVARGGLDLGELADETEKKDTEAKRKEFGELTGRLKQALGERVKDVRVTQRLTDSPACLVADEHDMSANLARILRAAGQKAPQSRPILEINPSHPIVARLKDETARFDDWAALLYEQALLAEGAALEDPAAFVRRMNALLLEFSAKS